MSWQDEHRKLSEQYSRDEISAEEFRTRRDQLFAAASGEQDATQAPPPDATQAMRPVTGPPPAGPGPAGSAQQPQQGQGHSERTQVVRGVGGASGQFDADRTQVVPGGAPGGAPPYPPAGQPDAPPPWASEEPPLVAPGSSDWLQQGPDVFQEKTGGKGKIVAVVVVVVVLVGLAFGAYLLWGRGSGNNNAGPNPQPTTSKQLPPKPADIFPLGNLPGGITARKDITQVSQLSSLHYLVNQELQAYTNSSTRKVKIATGTLSDGTQVAILFAQAKDAQAAFGAVQSLNAVQVHNGRTQATNAPDHVLVATIDAKTSKGKRLPAGIRAHYSHNDVIVRIDVSGSSLKSITPDFNSILSAQLKALPANG